MAMVRCYACRTEFEAEAGTCPACGADGGAVVKLETIHLDAPSKTPGRGVGYAACDPKLRPGGGGRFTGETAAVTCKACKQADAYKAAAADQDAGRVPAAVGFRINKVT